MAATAVKKRWILIIIAIFIIIAFIIAITVPFALRAAEDDESPSDEMKDSVDCYPEAQGDVSKITEAACTARGCRFNPSPPANTPVCAYQAGQYDLQVSDLKDKGPDGLEIVLRQKGQAPFGGDVKEWTLLVMTYGSDVMRFSFTPRTGSRYRVPINLNLEAKSSPGTSGLHFVLTNRNSLAFHISRRSTGTVIWETNGDPGSLVLSNQFLQIVTKLPSGNVFGLGENRHDSFRHDVNKTWPAFSRDQPPSFTDEANLYGVHPFYTCVEDKLGNTHGVFLLNSNAQEYSFSPAPSLTFRTIGGILDFFVFLGPSPEQVVQQYTGVIGRPVMPPYWALGFQLCRYGYNNISNLMDAVETTKQYQIPHDVQYVDIDHMDTRKIFTIDEVNFPGLNDYFKSLRQDGMKIIYILDPCVIANETGYAPYDLIAAVDGNIKWKNLTGIPENYTDNNGAILGYVWPQGPVAFPDYFKEQTKRVWEDLIVRHREKLIFDGLWIDMNEPASFGTNEERPFNWPEDVKPYFSLQCPQSALDDPPYRPKAAYMWDYGDRKARLSDKTICLNTVQGEGEMYSQYDVHSLYGYSQSEPTLRAARSATGERSIVISRSTYPGSGQYVGHWLGDNVSQWKDMHSSIIGMLEFNLFGIPYIGADICGFFGNTTVSLCKRWMQLGAFYPFSRNHNGINYIPQGPGQLGDEVGNASRDILQVRYRLLPYLYLLFYQAHTQGGTVVRPLHHEFPQDQIALTVDTQFLWGECLLISPILYENQTEIKYYLPKGRWYDYLSPKKYEYKDLDSGEFQTENVTKDDMPRLHLRGGCILVLQKDANNTHFSRQQPLTIMAALDKNEIASGKFFWDDGVSQLTHENYTYLMAELQAQNKNLTWTITHDSGMLPFAELTFEKVVVLGVTDSVTNVTGTTDQGSDISVTFTQKNHELEIILDASAVLRQNFSITWS